MPVTLTEALQAAVAHHQAGRLAQAESIYRQILAVVPNHPDTLHLLGVAAHQQKRFAEAESLISRALAAGLDQAEVYCNLGNALAALKRWDDAIAAFHRAIALAPHLAQAHCNLGITLRDAGHYDEAISAGQEAVRIDPHLAEGFNSLGVTLHAAGRTDDALAAYRRALALAPSPRYHSNLLFALVSHGETDPESVFAEHRVFNAAYSSPLTAAAPPHPIPRDPNRRLRVGYLSGDFRQHSVSYFLTGLFSHHDPAAVEIACYFLDSRSDAVTARLKSHAAIWRDVESLSDDALASQIRADSIDILVDLVGHCGYNRALVLARRPAPIQLSFLGYPNTTGLSAVDYRFTDALADPPGVTDRYHTETLLRLPCAWCYDPPADAPGIAPIPDGPIVFGSFNDVRKITPRTVALWSAAVRAVPDSRLLLKSAGLGDPATQSRLRALFSDLDPARLDFLPRDPTTRDHLSAYARVSISLDTFPYHGTTTTCESLWMGVPVVSLQGQTHVARVGGSLLSAAGLPHLVAYTEADWLGIISRLATDRPALAHLRRTLRERLRSSLLLDAVCYAHSVESAYRDMFRIRCLP